MLLFPNYSEELEYQEANKVLKSVLKGAIDSSFCITNLCFDLSWMACWIPEEYISEILSPLVQESEWEDVSELKKGIITSLRSAMAYRAMYDYSLHGEVIVSQSGIHRHEDDRSKTAYKNQVNVLREYLRRQSWAFLEQTLLLLKAENDPLYLDSAQKKYFDSFPINTAAEFKKCGGMDITREVMETLFPIMNDIICLQLIPCLTAEDYAKVLADDGCFKFLKKVLVYRTLAQAVLDEYIELTPRGVVIKEYTNGTDFKHIEKRPDYEIVKKRAEALQGKADSYFSMLTKCMCDNPDTYAAFNALKQEAEPPVEETNCCIVESSTHKKILSL